jgi:hypothetical protein
MKRLIYILSFSLLTNLAVGQNCDYYKNETDEFTKAIKKITKSQTINNQHNADKTEALYLALKRIDNSKFLELTIFRRHSLGGRQTYCFAKDSKVMIKLSNDSIRTLTYIGDVDCANGDVTSSQYGSYTDYNLTGNFLLTDELLDELGKNKMTKIRIYFTDFYTETDIPEKLKKPLGGYPILGDKMMNPQEYFRLTVNCIR